MLINNVKKMRFRSDHEIYSWLRKRRDLEIYNLTRRMVYTKAYSAELKLAKGLTCSEGH